MRKELFIIGLSILMLTGCSERSQEPDESQVNSQVESTVESTVEYKDKFSNFMTDLCNIIDTEILYCHDIEGKYDLATDTYKGKLDYITQRMDQLMSNYPDVDYILNETDNENEAYVLIDYRNQNCEYVQQIRLDFTTYKSEVYGDIYDSVDSFYNTPEPTTWDVDNLEYPENEIIALKYYENYAWSYQCNGQFIMSDGKLYKFDFKDTSELELLDRLKQYAKDNKPSSTVDISILKDCYNLGMHIDINDHIETKVVMYDAGSTAISFYNNIAGEELYLDVNGDVQGTTHDKYGIELLDKLNQLFK